MLHVYACRCVTSGVRASPKCVALHIVQASPVLYLNSGHLSLSLCDSPVLHHPFPSLPINEAADTPDLLTQLLQDLFFATNLQQLESRGMHVNFVCVIW